jgi:hypothetical protein
LLGVEAICLDEVSWLNPPLPGSETPIPAQPSLVPFREFCHPSLTILSDLSPEDIGSLVVEEVDGVFMAHYQIVALGAPDEAFAVSINDFLGLLSRSGYTDTRILRPDDLAVATQHAQSEGPRPNTTQLVLRSTPAERTDVAPPKTSESLGSFGKASPHSLTRTLMAIKAFKKAVRRFTLNNYLKEEFVLVEHLDQWAQGKATDPSRPNTTWIVLLLVDSHQYHGGIESYPTLTAIRNDIRLSRDKSIFRLFCILLQIDAGHLIEPLSYFICDDDLPLPYQNLESQLLARRVMSSAGDAQDLARQFVHAQYAFCCRPLVKRKVTKFNAYEIVPITRMEPVNDREQIANVYHIEMPSDYVSPAVQKLVSDEYRFEVDGIAVSMRSTSLVAASLTTPSTTSLPSNHSTTRKTSTTSYRTSFWRRISSLLFSGSLNTRSITIPQRMIAQVASTISYWS